VPNILKHGLRYGLHLGETTDAHGEDAASAIKTLKTRKAGNLDRSRFDGGHAVILDIPEREARDHDLVDRAPGVVHPSRIRGIVNTRTGSFTRHAGFDTSKDGGMLNRDVRPRGPSKPAPIPHPEPPPAGSSSGEDVW
jgi:hypothetical protein